METTGRELQIMHFIQPEDSMKRIPARIKNRRAAQRRRQVMRMKCLIRNSIFTLCAVILLAVSINAISAQATTKEEALTHTYKYYKSVDDRSSLYRRLCSSHTGLCKRNAFDQFLKK